ncbi:MAG: hypothetical protein ACOYVK_18955 [Bacillota bacterium]
MEIQKELKEGFSDAFEILKKLIDHSFDYMQKNPDKRDEIMELWQNYVRKFITYSLESSEKYNDREVFKAISKALLFGK